MTKEKYGLNDEQWEAITLKSPVFVGASAGAGKTKSLVSKIQYLLDSGVSSENILAITFTNKAAKEMKDRLSKKSDISKMQISTIHSMCVKIIQKFIKHTHLKLPFTIYDDSDQKSIIKTVIKARSLPGDPYEYLSMIGRAKSSGVAVDDPTESKVFEAYQKILKQNNACDFDDLLIFANDCLQHHDCKFYYSSLWKHILVDEFQDTSIIQANIVYSIYDPLKTQTLFLIGDSNQSVYSWRGACPSNIDNFIKKYNANVKYLTYNYRSCSDVINHANIYLQFGKPMVPKTPVTGRVSVTEFESQEQEAESIAAALKQVDNYNGTAVIYRINTRSLLFEQTFSKYRIPYKVVNDISFFHRKVSKDLLAALKAANNPDDRESLSRIINNPKRGFGDAKKEQLLLHGRSYVEEFAKGQPFIKSFMEILDDIKGLKPADATRVYLERSGYRTNLTSESDIYMVDAIQNMVAQYDNVEDLLLASNFVETKSEDGVNLITAHASKGLEYDRVFVVGVEQDLWPHRNSLNIEEEERLFYVACTRAKKYLNISYSRTKPYRGTKLGVSPSYLFQKSYEHLRPS